MLSRRASFLFIFFLCLSFRTLFATSFYYGDILWYLVISTFDFGYLVFGTFGIWYSWYFICLVFGVFDIWYVWYLVYLLFGTFGTW